MTAEERAAVIMGKTYGPCDRQDLGEAIAEAIKTAEAAMQQRCAKVACEQPFYPDTHTGRRQQWVKDQIVASILALQ